MTTTINYQRFAGIPHGDMCTWAAWVADLEETTPETEADEPRCDCELGRVIDEYAELVAALEAIYTTAIEPDATFSEVAFRDAILNSRALLAHIKGESK